MKTTAALVALNVLFGCAHQVRLVDLKAISGESQVPTYRHASAKGLVNGAPQYDSYIVSAPDLVEFSRKDGKVGAIRVEAADCSPCAICTASRLPIGTVLANDGPRPRLSGFVLNAAQAIRIDPGQGERAFDICAMPVLGDSWAHVGTRLAKAKPLDVALLPRPERRAMPGDSVRITIEYQTGADSDSDSGAVPFTLVETLTRIDASGRVYVPSLSLPSPAMKDRPIFRVLQQEAAGAALRVPLWRHEYTFDMQPTLDEVERCLAARWTANESFDGLEVRCRAFGIDENSFGAKRKDNQKIRYRLELEQSWTIVLWNGRRIERPFVPGQSVSVGAREVFREAFGREPFFGEMIYATVDPRRELRALGDAPFYARLDEVHTVLESVLLAPGDVVHLSHIQPYRLRHNEEAQ